MGSQGIVVGRGHEYSFRTIQDMGHQMVETLGQKADSSAAQSQTEEAPRALPGPGRMDQLTRRLQAIESGGSVRLMLKDRDARGSQPQVTHRKVLRRPF